MNVYGKLAIVGVFAFAALQFVRPAIPAKPAAAEVDAPQNVRSVLNQSCYGCHSDERRLSWFDHIVPGYWLVRHDILTAREHLNFSTLGAKAPAAQKAALYESVNMMQLGAMPLRSFLLLHPDAKVTSEDLAALKAYLAPWTSPPNAPASATAATPGAPQPPVSLAAVHAGFNGFPFDSAFESWKPISFTDRGDNNTFRFVLGNDIAVEAARSGHISPWPDGSRFAKIAWQQETGPDGLIHPGQFVQVELMLRGAGPYKKTESWNWGRWRGPDLTPYGTDASFVNECTGCHMPMRPNDYVYTLPMTTAQVPEKEVVNDQAAALPAGLPYQPLDWNAITVFVDPQAHTMSALYGNDAAMQSVGAHRTAPGAAAYSAGSVLALVTWTQRDDPHWFGARIPGTPQSVEFVQVAASGPADHYQRFAGVGVPENQLSPAEQAKRANFILNLPAAWLP
jgi:mono/diheme cytochrome c family protein